MIHKIKIYINNLYSKEHKTKIKFNLHKFYKVHIIQQKYNNKLNNNKYRNDA